MPFTLLTTIHTMYVLYMHYYFVNHSLIHLKTQILDTGKFVRFKIKVWFKHKVIFFGFIFVFSKCENIFCEIQWLMTAFSKLRTFKLSSGKYIKYLNYIYTSIQFLQWHVKLWQLLQYHECHTDLKPSPEPWTFQCDPVISRIDS